MFPCPLCLPFLIGPVPIILQRFAQSWLMPALRVERCCHLVLG